jgi:hypothetical protein
MAKKFYVKSAAQMMGAYNLPTVDEKGRKLSLIISRNEVSRPLTEEEFNSREIQKGISGRDLVDVTKQING